MERIVITGVERSVGAGIATALASHYDVVGLHDSRCSATSNLPLESCVCDLGDAAALAEAVRSRSPAYVVHCGALARSSWNAWTIAEYADLAAEPAVTRALADVAVALSGHLTVISTDAVFAGPRMFHDEQAPCTAEGPLAAAARAVETELAKCDALIVRTNAFGWGASTEQADFAECFWRALEDGRPISTTADAYATPILAVELARRLLVAIERRWTGIAHFGGAERVSPRRFATELAGVMGVRARVANDPTWHVASPATAAIETTLTSQRCRSEPALAPPLLHEQLVAFVDAAERAGRQPRVWRGAKAAA
jgi:dTDP-4-dehydrorhamnose reductase